MDHRRPIPTQRQRAKGETWARIIAAGRLLFDAHPYDRVNLRQISKAAGVTTGGFFSHFNTKQHLWETCCGGMRMPTPAAYMEIVHMLDIMSGEAIRLDSPADVFRAERALETARTGINGDRP